MTKLKAWNVVGMILNILGTFLNFIGTQLYVQDGNFAVAFLCFIAMAICGAAAIDFTDKVVKDEQ